MITSTSNIQVKQLLQLQKKARERAAQDVFVVEGIKMYQEVPKERLVRTYVSESFYKKRKELFAKGQQVTVMSDRVFESVSDTKTPQGVLCLVRQYHYELQDLLGECPLVMALENIQDPGNLGTILRTAEGAGVTGVLMSAGCVDIYNPKVIRSTMGSVYRMPFYYAENWEGALNSLKQAGVSVYAAHLRGRDTHDRQDYRSPSAFLIGNESRGLSEETAAFADTYIRIPMCGQVESLNAAVASAILMYEANRQRRG
ncbi:MAG: RNA methyltransferase [Lachnospiraceae bacterium]|nr:RNA methyltransferase [Lachnospiraceae bacterium]